jgi:hypothetical protein
MALKFGINGKVAPFSNNLAMIEYKPVVKEVSRQFKQLSL